MIIDGRKLAEERKQEVKIERATYGALSLGLVMATTNAVTQSYVGIKKRAAADLDITVAEYRLPDNASIDEIITATREASVHDGIILQLPLPQGIDIDTAKNAIKTDIDVDVLSDSAFEKFEGGTFAAIPPVPAAMHYVLRRNNIDPKGKRVVIIGKGRLVGRPAAVLFAQLGAEVIALEKGDDVPSNTITADIIISGAGVGSLIKPEMIKEGVVILDGGTSELGGKVVGDADPSCADKALIFTPVPGGIGPIAVVEIFANLVNLKRAGAKR